MSFLKDKEHELRIERLEEQVKQLDNKYAIKLVQTIVFGIIGIAGTTAIGAWVNSVLGLF